MAVSERSYFRLGDLPSVTLVPSPPLSLPPLPFSPLPWYALRGLKLCSEYENGQEQISKCTNKDC
jgi:hypothetical protein